MNYQLVMFALLLGFSLARAGEIIILQPQGKESRSERNAARTSETARRNLGKSGADAVVIEDGVLDAGSGAQRASREARDYLRSNDTSAPGDERTTIILRNAPPGDAEKSRQKAAAYVQPGNTATRNQPNCGDVTLSVGTIGDRATPDRKVTITEKGNTSVNLNCRK